MITREDQLSFTTSALDGNTGAVATLDDTDDDLADRTPVSPGAKSPCAAFIHSAGVR